VSQVGTFIGFLVLGSANALWMLFLGRIIDGLTAGNLSIAQAYISDVTKPEDRTRAFGLIGIAFGLGFVSGPAISGVLGHRFGYSAPAFAAAGLSFASIMVTWFVLPESARAPSVTPSRIGSLRFFRLPGPRRCLLAFLAFALAFSTLNGGLALFLQGRFSFNVEETAFVYLFSGLVGGLLQGGIGRIAKRLGEPRLALVGFFAMAVGYSLLAVTFNLPVLAVVTAISAAGSAVVRPAITTLLTKSVDRTEQGAVLGMSQSLTSSAQIVGPMMAGFLIEHRRLGAYGLTAGLFAAAGTLLFLLPKDPAAAAA
jgi:predicted MFS family arabinose efflux permease